MMMTGLLKPKKLFLFFVIGLSCICSACTFPAQHLRTLPMNTHKTVDAGKQTDANILIFTFDDLRGDEYLYIYPTNYIPFINILFAGVSYSYPETSGVLRQQGLFCPTVCTGSLDSAFPHLLANMMRQMRFTTNAIPISQAKVNVDFKSYDYVVMGKINRSTLKHGVNLIPCAIPLSIIGAPVVFLSYDLEFEVQLFHSGDMKQPTFRKTYQCDDSAVRGLYYGHSAGYELFSEILETVLSEVVLDISNNVK